MLISTVIISVPNAFATYSLSVNICCGTFMQQQNGVDIGVINTSTQAAQLKQFYVLPPPTLYFYFTDYEMPPGTTFRVCALFHATSVQINCAEYMAGQSTSESALLSLSPLRQ